MGRTQIHPSAPGTNGVCFPRRRGAEDAALRESRARAPAEAGDLATLGPGSGGRPGVGGAVLGNPRDRIPGRDGGRAVARGGGDPVAVTWPLGLRAGRRAAGR